MLRKLTLLLFFLSFINAQIALPTFQAVHIPHTTVAASGSQTFSYTGAQQTFTVPSGVTSIEIKAYGAAGGSHPSNADSDGVYSSSANNSGTSGGWNGGGRGGAAYGSSGGGASDVRSGGTALSNRVIVAGAGGGGGTPWSGGAGGSSYFGGVTNGSTTSGQRSGNGQIIITW